MSFQTQKSQVKKPNPFELHARPAFPQTQTRERIGAHAMSRASSSAQRSHLHKPQSFPPGPVPVSEPIRRKAALKKKSSFWALLRRPGKILGLVFLSFVLLPSSAQHRLLQALPFAPPAVEITVPPLPVAYDYISSPFGKRWGRQHQGIDFAASVGQPIYATKAGKVIHSGWEFGYGKSVVIDHGHGLQTRYAHCSKLLVKVGAEVDKGEEIGLVGSTGHSTGPHLHFEVIVDGVRKNPAWYYAFDNKETRHLANAGEQD